MINERDGGVNGVGLVVEECEPQYDTKQGVECYERLKGKDGGGMVFNPLSTAITYQLIRKAGVDKIVIHSMGYGMTAAADGRWFPWVFTFPTTYWSQASSVIRYIGQQEGGLDKLKGKKIVHIYHNSAYGKEANPTLEELARLHGFELTLLAVDHPGQEQKATWLQVRRINPAWVFMSGWGVMNQVAVKEAAAINFPMDHFIGNWWAASEADSIPCRDGSGLGGRSSARGTRRARWKRARSSDTACATAPKRPRRRQRSRRERRRPSAALGEQHRGDLRSRDPRVEGRVAPGPRGGHRGPPRRQRGGQVHHAEGHLGAPPHRARPGDPRRRRSPGRGEPPSRGVRDRAAGGGAGHGGPRRIPAPDG